MIVYRINSCKFIHDLSGKGAAMYGGRWNNRDTYVIYTAESRALALLEAVVHMGKVPVEHYCMATIEIPDGSIMKMELEDLPDGWNGNPPPDYLREIGDRFVRANKHLVLSLPSVLMMEEHNYLLNPLHPDFRRVKIIAERPVIIDDRLFRA